MEVQAIMQEPAADTTFMVQLLSLHDRMSRLEEETCGLQEEARQARAREARFWEPRVRSLAAQLLLLACNQQHLCKSECDDFRKMGVDNAAVLHLAQAMGATAQQVVANADAVMSHQIHPPTLADLEQEVAKVRSILFPELEQLCSWECRLIRAYEDIKRAFPLSFKGTAGVE